MGGKDCPRIHQCLINRGLLEIDKERAVKYKLNYCCAGFERCKRYIIIERLHLCPDFVMPDSSLTIEEVMDRMENEM